jgi:hypothetical protein
MNIINHKEANELNEVYENVLSNFSKFLSASLYMLIFKEIDLLANEYQISALIEEDKEIT